MLQRVNIRTMEDLYLPLRRRSPVGAYFIRVTEYGETARDWIWKCHEAALKRGVIIDGGLRNPDGRELAYYRDVLGDGFEASRAFVNRALSGWIPGMGERVRLDFATAIMNEISLLKRAGKTDSMIRNTYIKLMCWLYYRFAGIIPFLGQDEVPKVLYVGDRASSHEMIMLRIVCSVGADILAAETGKSNSGGENGTGEEPDGVQTLKAPDAVPFPPGFSLKTLRAEMSPRPGKRPEAGKGAAAGNGTAPKAAPGAVPGTDTERKQPSGRPAAKAGIAPVPSGSPAGRAVPKQNKTGGSETGAPSGIARKLPEDPRGSGGTGIPEPRRASGGGVRGLDRIGMKTPEKAVPAGDSIAPKAAAPARPDIEERFTAPKRSVCSNAWITSPSPDAVLTPPESRGEDPALFYTAFIRCEGVRDRLTYASELFRLYQQMNERGRTLLVIDGPVPQPEADEIDAIRRRNYKSCDEMIVDLALNLPRVPQTELEREMQLAFVRAVKRAAEEETNIRRLTVSAVIALCWIRRYHSALFKGWKETDVPAVFKMGGCESEAETVFFLYLSFLPVDILILCPDLSRPCRLRDERLLVLKGEGSLKNMPFPMQSGALQMSTAASSAERELTEMLYTDSGLYRRGQFDRAEAIVLNTTLDEIFILWDQEMKFRPNFSAVGTTVNIPVIFARVSGVKNKKTGPYWQKIKQLRDAENTLYFNSFPVIPAGGGGKYQKLAVRCIKNGKILTEELRSAREYPFGLLRSEMQDHIFRKLQTMLDERIIKGTFVNGAEYTVLSTALSVGRETLRLIQGFDFTGRNPKLVVVSAGEEQPTLEDAVLLTFLSEIGFDVVMFVPTGYRMIGQFLNDRFPVDHQEGDYMYDLEVPDLNAVSAAKGISWLNNLLKR